MATIILIHGAWHGGWCWEEVEPLLEARGHAVLAPDLPGMGADRTPWAENVLGQWTDFVASLVESQPEPVVLVGHSRGGLLVSTVAERMPKRVQLAVYLAAFLLGDGETALDPEPGTPEFLAALETDANRGIMTVDPARVPKLCYTQTTPDVAARAVARLRPEPLQPYNVRLRLSAERFGRVARAYIETTDDRNISLAKQREMAARWSCDPVVTLESDHSPFYSMPGRLAEVVDNLSTARPNR